MDRHRKRDHSERETKGVFTPALNQTHFPLWYALQVRDKHLPGLNTYALYSGMLQGTVDVERSVQTSNEP